MKDPTYLAVFPDELLDMEAEEVDPVLPVHDSCLCTA